MSDDDDKAAHEEEEAEEEPEPNEADDDEVIAEIVAVLQDLVDDGHLELATRRGARFLASPLFARLDRDKSAEDIADWLVDRKEVSELYLDNDEVAERFRAVLARMRGKRAPERFHPDLAAAIANANADGGGDDDDVQVWSVYADWLLEQGDPRGELMAMQIQRAGKDDPVIARKEEALLARHRRHFYGELPVSDADDNHAHVTFRNGFFDSAAIQTDEALEMLLALESARFLRTLTLRVASLDPIDAILAKKTLPKTLTTLDLRAGQSGYDTTRRGRLDVGRATRGLDRLESVVVHATDVAISKLETPRLRRLRISAESARFASADVFEGVSALERLELDIANPPSVTKSKALEALFANPPPNLTWLALRRFSPAATSHALVEALVRSPLAKQLRQLDLRRSDLRDRDGELLLSHKDDFKRLEAVDLRGNTLLPTVASRIAERWASSVDDDEDDDDDERYDDTDE